MGDLPSSGSAAAELAESEEPRMSDVPLENWTAANKAASELIKKVQLNSVSEEKRKAVIYYIRRLIKSCLGAEVFSYGSVPLKTYLPDGDIDLTVIGGANPEGTLANDMKSILEQEEMNPSAEFVVKDVQLICAEVKIVKCIVQRVVVDISFNQIGGLCTLCFLEQVDRIIGKDHLFKRSIILIKAWCYYESRILGAHHGLISTYALETLVLYIFHMYNSTLDGPISVLCKFLDYFSKFNWETYCVSLDGPIRLDKIPTTIDMPDDIDKDLLLSNDFLSNCVDIFSVPLRDEESARGFQSKAINIVDPLKGVNNLGRSVSIGNFFRIQSAFSYGSKKLLKMLVKPQHSINDEISSFFPNTMAHHGVGQRPDVINTRISPNFKTKQPDSISTNESLVSGNLDKNEKNHLVGKDEAAASGRTSDIFGDNVDSDKPETKNSVDLAGDYDSYFQQFQYARSFYEYRLGMRPLPMPMNPSYQPMWDTLMVHRPFMPNRFTHIPTLYAVRPVPPILLPAVPYLEGMPKARGIGTYFPAMNVPLGLPPPPVKERNQEQVPVDMQFSNHPNERHDAISHVVPQEAAIESEAQKRVTPSHRNFPGAKTSKTTLSREQERTELKSLYHLKDEDDFPPLSSI